jgi:hypothetical protein
MANTALRSSVDVLGNSAWNAIAFAVAVALNLVVLPFVVFRQAWLRSASQWLALSTTRELALRLEPSERDDAQRLFCHGRDACIGRGRLDRSVFLAWPEHHLRA